MNSNNKLKVLKHPTHIATQDYIPYLFTKKQCHKRQFAYCTYTFEDSGTTFRSCVSCVPWWNQTGCFTKWNHLPWYSQGSFCEVLCQNTDHGLHGHSQSSHLHPWQVHLRFEFPAFVFKVGFIIVCMFDWTPFKIRGCVRKCPIAPVSFHKPPITYFATSFVIYHTSKLTVVLKRKFTSTVLWCKSAKFRWV